MALFQNVYNPPVVINMMSHNKNLKFWKQKSTFSPFLKK